MELQFQNILEFKLSKENTSKLLEFYNVGGLVQFLIKEGFTMKETPTMNKFNYSIDNDVNLMSIKFLSLFPLTNNMVSTISRHFYGLVTYTSIDMNGIGKTIGFRNGEENYDVKSSWKGEILQPIPINITGKTKYLYILLNPVFNFPKGSIFKSKEITQENYVCRI